MMKILLLITISFSLCGCYFIDPINTPPTSYFEYQGLPYVGEEIRVAYNGDEDYGTLEFLWQMDSPPESKLGREEISFIQSQENNTVINQFIPDVPGDYAITLTVTDEYGAQHNLTKKITIQNRTPYAILNYTTATSYPVVGVNIILNGQDSYDRDDNIKYYRWSLKQRPVGSLVSNELLEQNHIEAGKTTFIPDQPGVYEIVLKVFDAESVAQGTLWIDVRNNQPPKVISTNPDHRLSLISLPKGGDQNVEVSIFDDDMIDIDQQNQLLTYEWGFILNGVVTDISSWDFKGSSITISQDYLTIGDLFDLKLVVSDFSMQQIEIIWHFIVTP